MKPIEQAAQECWRYAHRIFMDTCDDSQAQAIIAAAMREVCEPLAKTCQDASQLIVDYHKERDQLRAQVAELKQWKKESSDQLVQCGWDMSKMHQKIAELEQDKTIIDVPPQTIGDGTSSGPLSIFARGWNGYINTLREMHPGITFREGCIDVSVRFHGDMSIGEVNDYLRAAKDIHKSFCDEALTLCEDTGIAANIIAKMRELREQSLARIAEARKGQP